MSVIEITRHHTLDHDHAKAAADRLAKSLSDRFEVACTWHGDRLTFKRTGAHGFLEVCPQHIHVHLELGFLLRAFKGRIEDEIHLHLDGLIDES